MSVRVKVLAETEQYCALGLPGGLERVFPKNLGQKKAQLGIGGLELQPAKHDFHRIGQTLAAEQRIGKIDRASA